MQELKTIKLPVSGTEVQLRTQISGREKRAYRAETFAIYDDTALTKIQKIEKVEDAVIRLVVVSIGGSKDNILDTLLNMPSQDYDLVEAEVTSIVAGLGKKKEEN